MTSSSQPRTYKYYDRIMAGFVTVLLCSNLIGASKVAEVGGFQFGGGILFFPLSYVFGDILTEVYGYSRSRRVVWAGFAALLFASLMSAVLLALPPAPGWDGQAHLEYAFGSTSRIFLASMSAFFVGELANSYVLARMKVLTQGKHLWMRTIGSTMVGEAFDTMIFYPIAFLGTWAPEMVLRVAMANYGMKVAWEVLATPFTYRIVAWLKREEHEDFYDRKTDFSPFKLS